MLASVLALPAESLTVKVGLRLFLSSALQSSPLVSSFVTLVQSWENFQKGIEAIGQLAPYTH